MAPARTPIRCAIYTRQSVEPHTDLSSCQVQFDLGSAYVQSQRSLGYVVVEERFDDEGYSGTTLDRPALHRLLSVVRSGGIEQLVIHRLDRLSRNLRHFVTLFEELRDHNFTLEIVTVSCTDRLHIRMGRLPRYVFTAGGREACKGVMVSAYEIETAVLSEIGADPKLTSKEQQAALRAAVRAAVCDAPSGNVKIELVVPHSVVVG